jgi:Apea-like HEPN
MQNKSLRPDPTIKKILISTTSRLYGEHESTSILIAHAWPYLGSRVRENESPVSRNAFIVAFITEPTKDGIQKYSRVNELICPYLSVLYGKRFDNHGTTEDIGSYRTPDMNLYNNICNHNLLFNSHKPRDSFEIPLNITHFAVIESAFTDSNIDIEFLSKLNAACKFYHQALQNAESEPEIAYLHLISAGEIISSHFKYDEDEKLDKDILEILGKLRDGNDDQIKLAGMVTKRLFSIRKTFVMSLRRLIDEDFFREQVVSHQCGAFKAETMETNIRAAYDLRSKYVHTGSQFGCWIEPASNGDNLQVGSPCVKDKEFKKILALAPTFNGMERIIRYCLLKLMSDNGFDGLNKIRVRAETEIITE